MSLFDMDGMEPALDGMIPALAAKVGMENEINNAQGAVGSYKLPLCQYTCIDMVVACSFQQKYDFSKVPF
jgi:hypothetical protein